MCKLKRVLYIAYYWPPSGGIGILRNVKFVKYLKKNGWEPIVFAPKNASYPIIDNSTEKDLFNNIEKIEVPIFEPYSLFNLLKGKKPKEQISDVFLVNNKTDSFTHKLGLWIRANFFIPDARFLWINPSVKFLRKYLQTAPVDIIISSGPPHSVHLIAQKISNEFNIPWLCDWQDPWTEIDYFDKFKLTNSSRKKHIELEQSVLYDADTLVTVSKSWCKDMERLSGKKVHYLPLGFDEDDFKNIEQNKVKKFTISHFGMLGIDRNPVDFWKAISEVLIEISEFKNHLQIHLAGSVDVSVFKALDDLGLTSFLVYDKYINKSELFDYLVNSEINLVLINKPEEGINYNSKGRIPAKIFECIGAGKPILAIGPIDSDVAEILKETEQGEICNYNDFVFMKQVIKNWYVNYLNNKPSVNTKNANYYSYSSLVHILEELLNNSIKINNKPTH